MCKNLLNFTVEGVAVNFRQVGNELSDQDVLRQCIRRIESVVWDHHLAGTERHPHLALIPGGANENDLVYIIPGCSVPVVLREEGKGLL
ncbi:hypothetical protein K469DRAFT_58663 [Zopfia rhizophila CBS 207.26]|uniref:Uncharacterized protein n=1 Tax=Zopfia rhizophila CBS 207.26 TaxID=1314779 RepID=A0A6A6EEV5_9PEZI|nr:hypothetical protein K469DRAFT_58663 [Zopfia rhizophila CBS 207.26]